MSFKKIPIPISFFIFQNGLGTIDIRNNITVTFERVGENCQEVDGSSSLKASSPGSPIRVTLITLVLCAELLSSPFFWVGKALVCRALFCILLSAVLQLTLSIPVAGDQL